MMNADLAQLTIAEASRRIDAGEESPLELTEAAYARIEDTDARINAFVRLMRDTATAEAMAATERASNGARLGPLDGIPIAVKDLYDTANVVTNAGTNAFIDRVPAEDSTAVAKLRTAGAVILGKTNTHELALGGTTNNFWHGPTRNPWNLDRVPGGSSGGSGAALAVGQALGALGSDTGGSIRIPAAFCGITGHKPTFGLVGRGGVVPLSLTLDHAGPMARGAEDCALLLNALQGYDPRDLDSVERPDEDFTADLPEDAEGSLEGLTLGVIPSLTERADSAVLVNFEASVEILRELGAEITTVEPMAGEADWRGPLGALLIAEGASYIEEILRQRPGGIAEPVRSRMLAGLDIPGPAVVRAHEQRKLVERKFEAALDGIDAYLCPTSPGVAEVIAADPTEREPATTFTKFNNTMVFDYTHQPSISVPNGLDGEGLPTGLMISTARFDDALALRIAHAYQLATSFHEAKPPPL
jgi:aspartyl-tRNA(Asn)/glutamyl-tRNA(Gln) amidotransferase subunit A